MSPSSADERRHSPGPERYWGESWYFDFAAPDASLGGYVRLGLYPNQRIAWWWAYLVGEDRSLVAVRDHEVELPPGNDLELRAEGLWASLTCETPHEHWTIGMEAFGVSLEDPADAYRAERGDRIAVGLDLEWEERSPVYDYALTTRYEQACTVHGEILLGNETIAFDGTGERDHSWGVRDWWSFPWTWTAGQLDDGTAFHAAGTHLDGATIWREGFTSRDGGLVPLESFTIDTVLGAEGLPSAATMHLGELALDVMPVGHAPVQLVADDGRVGRFPRSLCRFRSMDGAEGTGWTEWNQPSLPS